MNDWLAKIVRTGMTAFVQLQAPKLKGMIKTAYRERITCLSDGKIKYLGFQSRANKSKSRKTKMIAISFMLSRVRKLISFQDMTCNVKNKTRVKSGTTVGFKRIREIPHNCWKTLPTTYLRTTPCLVSDWRRCQGEDVFGIRLAVGSNRLKYEPSKVTRDSGSLIRTQSPENTTRPRWRLTRRSREIRGVVCDLRVYTNMHVNEQ